MRLLGFMAIGRVLHRHGLPAKVIGDIEVESFKVQLLMTSEAERLKRGDNSCQRGTRRWFASRQP